MRGASAPPPRGGETPGEAGGRCRARLLNGGPLNDGPCERAGSGLACREPGPPRAGTALLVGDGPGGRPKDGWARQRRVVLACCSAGGEVLERAGAFGSHRTDLVPCAPSCPHCRARVGAERRLRGTRVAQRLLRRQPAGEPCPTDPPTGPGTTIPPQPHLNMTWRALLGGHYFLLNARDMVSSRTVLATAARTISRELRFQYSLGYPSSGGGTRSRSVRAENTRPDVVIRTQRGDDAVESHGGDRRHRPVIFSSGDSRGPFRGQAVLFPGYQRCWQGLVHNEQNPARPLGGW